MTAFGVTMVDTFGMTGIIVVVFLGLVAIYIFMRITGWSPASNEGDDEDFKGDRDVEDDADDEPGEDEPEAPAKPEHHELTDAEFIDSYTGPMLEDALDSMEDAVVSIQAGLEYYERGTWEAAGGEFHSAAKGIDAAAAQLREVTAMVEDTGSEPSKQARARMEECRLLRALTIRMEEACDARVDGKEAEAKSSELVRGELGQMVSNFKK
jgi:hypothetical protein